LSKTFLLKNLHNFAKMPISSKIPPLKIPFLENQALVAAHQQQQQQQSMAMANAAAAAGLPAPPSQQQQQQQQQQLQHPSPAKFMSPPAPGLLSLGTPLVSAAGGTAANTNVRNFMRQFTLHFIRWV
jgi:hypothetical protein